MSVGDTGPALHAYCAKSVDRGALETALSSAMASVGIATDPWKHRGVESHCTGTLGAAEFPLAFESSTDWTQLGLFRLHGREVAQLGGDGVFRLFFNLCEAAHASVGRSDGGIGSELVQESELHGAIRCLGWFNYYGSALAAIRRNDIRKATWARQQWGAAGSFGGAAWEEPMGNAHHGRQVAAELGLPW
jgi:hypothetical protein